MSKSKPHVDGHRISIIAFLFIVTFSGVAKSSLATTLPLIPGDILVSYCLQGRVTIDERSPTGALVQKLATPFLDPFDFPVGIAIDSQGHINLNRDNHNTRESYISNLDPVTGVWRTINVGHTTQAGFNYDLSVFQNYLFRRDARIDSNDLSAATVDAGFTNGASEMSVGLDGKLYAVLGGLTPQSSFHILDPVTLERIGGSYEIPGFRNIEGISATATGDIFVAVLGVGVQHFDSNLNLIKTLDLNGVDSPSSFSPSSLVLYSNGKIVLGDRFGKVVITDTSLDTYTTFSVATISGNLPQLTTYAALVVPEPSTWSLLGMACLGVVGWARLQKCRWGRSETSVPHPYAECA